MRYVEGSFHEGRLGGNMNKRLLIASLIAVTAALALGGGQAAGGPDSTNTTSGSRAR